MLRKIKLGLSTLPGYGEHPGTIWIFLMAFMGFAAGIGRGDEFGNPFLWGLTGSAVMLLFFGPIYLIGAYHRGDEYLRNLDVRASELKLKEDDLQ